MGYEYDAIPNDVDDYRRRCDTLPLELESLATFSRSVGAYEVWLSDPGRPGSGWEEVQLVFGRDRVRLTCMTPLSDSVRSDLRLVLALVGGSGGARYVGDDGEPAGF
ncbi:hypothetical protein [Lysobacter sp. Root690]|uniref:hypothetical protein n=1 Tax=Lysobacter sp. Root690 TaxID=1736588 RepID=UPI0006F3F4BB|nr:hypothetical protein [Lysobacter sp. Root690]KRB04399.1 hypothetical protein ASD86_18995 [Lysobacter sp. Root690]